MNKIKQIIHDIKINPITFCIGILLGSFFILTIDLINNISSSFFNPYYKNLESKIFTDISNTKKLLPYSKTDEETALIEELIAKQEEFEKIIPQGKKERKDFLEKYNIEMDLIISRYRAFIYEAEKEGKSTATKIYKKNKPYY